MGGLISHKEPSDRPVAAIDLGRWSLALQLRPAMMAGNRARWPGLS